MKRERGPYTNERRDRKNESRRRMTSRVGKDRERAGNRLVQMLKQTYKLTGFIPPFHSLRGG